MQVQILSKIRANLLKKLDDNSYYLNMGCETKSIEKINLEIRCINDLLTELDELVPIVEDFNHPDFNFNNKGNYTEIINNYPLYLPFINEWTLDYSQGSNIKIMLQITKYHKFDNSLKEQGQYKLLENLLYITNRLHLFMGKVKRVIKLYERSYICDSIKLKKKIPFYKNCNVTGQVFYLSDILKYIGLGLNCDFICEIFNYSLRDQWKTFNLDDKLKAFLSM